MLCSQMFLPHTFIALLSFIFQYNKFFLLFSKDVENHLSYSTIIRNTFMLSYLIYSSLFYQLFPDCLKIMRKLLAFMKMRRISKYWLTSVLRLTHITQINILYSWDYVTWVYFKVHQLHWTLRFQINFLKGLFKI